MLSKRAITLCRIILQLTIITNKMYAILGGLLSGGLKSGGLLSGGLMSGGLKSAHRLEQVVAPMRLLVVTGISTGSHQSIRLISVTLFLLSICLTGTCNIITVKHRQVWFKQSLINLNNQISANVNKNLLSTVDG